MSLEQNIGHLKNFLFSGAWENRKIRVQILNKLKGTKYVTFYLYAFLLSYTDYFRRVKEFVAQK